MKMLTDFNPPEDEIDYFEKKLYQYNLDKIDGYSYENFILKYVDDTDSVIAGSHCQIGGGWLYIASLWVDEKHRNKGIGKKLVAQAQEIAIQKKCVGIYLYTYNFQSPIFYKKLGFRVFGELENFCDGNSKLYMKKNLV
jgi:ribosomal protein S18 acetylase RimI-like enzyme